MKSVLGIVSYVQEKVKEGVVSVETEKFVLFVQKAKGSILDSSEIQLHLYDAELVVERSYLFAQNEQMLDQEEVSIVLCLQVEN